ncbi:MAG: hypothetical protein IPM51_06655 [Sphingobacteriaceae bacterium]|nr:hypothetical protein [Sphingobacteriaceae bacterium]
MEDKSGLLGLEYYPTTFGKFVIYDVDSIVYTDLPVDTVIYKYRIKEKIADEFIDNEGKPAFRLERYIKVFNPNKSYDSIPWTIKEVWMINADKKSIQISERDIRYTKLVFPIQEKFSWKGNVQNNLGDWDYIYDYVDKAEIINNVSLDKVLQVKQFDQRTLISWKVYTEKYAKDIGLVYREITELYSNKVLPGIPVENRIENGILYKQKIISYGHE